MSGTCRKELYDVYTLSVMKFRVKVSQSLGDVFEEMDVVLITGMTIPNETLPEMLKHCKGTRLKIIYRPSFLLSKKALQNGI